MGRSEREEVSFGQPDTRVRHASGLARTGECAAQEDSDFVGLTEAGLDQTGYIALTVP